MEHQGKIGIAQDLDKLLLHYDYAKDFENMYDYNSPNSKISKVLMKNNVIAYHCNHKLFLLTSGRNAKNITNCIKNSICANLKNNSQIKNDDIKTLSIINSDWIKFIYGTGWLWALLVSTKFGNNILAGAKHLWYKIKNPPIIYSASFEFEFKEINTTQINNLAEAIYKSTTLSKYKLNRNGQINNCYKLHYPGLDYIITVEQLYENTNLTIKIKETESNYNNLNNHIKNIVIYAFIKEIVLAKILETYTTMQFTSKYQFNMKFSERKYNFFLKERFTNVPKGYVSDALVTIKDVSEDDFILTANLNGISICVKNDFDKFIRIFLKYISII